ncbi:DNA-binding response regulator [Cohnella yongneupensis]|uniref:DNA-binding response regulator n=1 Tax=Cohnella yongneupensis TaxID=425006 RepID=A0ABW0R5I1_9BACL
MSKFEKVYAEWLAGHKSEASGERLRRLTKKHGYGEKLLLEQAWWPVIGNLDHLYPEYEFINSEGGYYYIDLAYVRLPRPAALESDSFGSHARDIDRDKFSRDLDRQNDIVLADWNILRFSIDKLKENPIGCQNTLRRMLVIWYGAEHSNMEGLNVYQREIVRFAIRSGSAFSVEQACGLVGRKEKFVRKQLHELLEMDILESASIGSRVCRYKIKPNGLIDR